MADKLSKFNIKGTLADVIDAEARASIAELSEDVSGMASDVSSAVSTAEDAKTTAEEALNGLTTKQDVASALKYDRASKTFSNITIPANSNYAFPIPIPDGITNPRPIYARNTSGNLVIVNMYVLGSDMYIQLRNTSDTPITADQTVEVTFLYN